MRVKAAKWGNSLAVRLPKEAVRALDLHPGQAMTMDIAAGAISLTRLEPRKRIPTLDELCDEALRLGPDHEPETVDWGPDVGSEIIDDEWSRGELPPPKFLDGD